MANYRLPEGAALMLCTCDQDMEVAAPDWRPKPICGDYSTITAGEDSTITAGRSTITAGRGIEITAGRSTITAGDYSTITAGE